MRKRKRERRAVAHEPTARPTLFSSLRLGLFGSLRLSLFPPVSSLALSFDRPSPFPPRAIPRPSFSFALSPCRAVNPFPLRLPLRAASPRSYCHDRPPARSIPSTLGRIGGRAVDRDPRDAGTCDAVRRIGGGEKSRRGAGGRRRGAKSGTIISPDKSGSPRSVYHSVSSAVSLTRGWGKLVLQPLLSACSVWGRFIQRNCRERDTCWHVGPLTIPDTRARVPLPWQPPFPSIRERDSIRENEFDSDRRTKKKFDGGWRRREEESSGKKY